MTSGPAIPVNVQGVAASNQLQLLARLLHMHDVRYTPAGVAVRNCVLAHESEQMQADRIRKVSLHIRAVALDQLALELDSWTTGQQAIFRGFLSTPHWSSRQAGENTSVVFHLQAIEPVHPF